MYISHLLGLGAGAVPYDTKNGAGLPFSTTRLATAFKYQMGKPVPYRGAVPWYLICSLFLVEVAIRCGKLSK